MTTYVKTAFLALLLLATAEPTASNAANACSNTTDAAFSACLFDAQDDFWIGTGKCQNESESNARAACLADNRASLQERKRERKYYKPGIGEILSVDLETGERTKLVKIIGP